MDWVQEEQEKKEKHRENVEKLNFTLDQISDAFEAIKKLEGMASPESLK